MVAHSIAEAEYRAMAHATIESIWLYWLLVDMGISISSLVPLYCYK